MQLTNKLNVNQVNQFINLQVDSDAFLGLERLEELNLSGNHVRYLAPNALCPAGKIELIP